MNKKLHRPNLNKPDTQKYITLGCNRVVPDSLYVSIENQVKDIIDGMEASQLYTLRQLCGEEYWAELKTNFNCRRSGYCLADMVRKGKLPLKFAGKKGNSWLYALAEVTH